MREHLNKIRYKIHHTRKRIIESDIAHWRKVKFVILGSIAFLAIIGVLMFFIILLTLPNIGNVRNLVAAQSSLILDRNGEILYAIYGDENRKLVNFEDISKYAPLAAMAIEDDAFYDHGGVDFKALALAICGEIKICSTSRGGSTITQQFVKNAFLSPERSYTRKAKEIILALQLESKYGKDEIMEMYLNRIPYGANIYGVEVASKTFFGKTAKELSIAESAILAAIPKAPTYYSPYGSQIYAQIDIDEEEILKQDIRSEQDLVDLNRNFITKGLLGKTYSFGEGDDARDVYMKGRVAFVLERMELLGYITSEERETAQIEADVMEFQPFREDITAPHFVMYVRQLLEEKYGKEQIEKGGLRVTTTLDIEMQKMAEKSIEDRAEYNETNFLATNASLISVDPNTGEIMAMVGSRDFWNDDIDGKVNITLRSRLPGSSFKPIAYAAAFLQGYAPSTVIYDVKTKFGAWYEPNNFDGKFRGPVSMRSALGGSLNVPAVKTGHLAGIPNVLDLARKMGIGLNQPDDWYGLSLALGAGEARPLDMALAYSVFANGGYKVEPVAILKVEDRTGNILEEYNAPDKKNLVLDPQVAYLINNILSDTSVRPGDYWRNQLTIPGYVNAAKTGTSNKEKNDIIYPFDTWTIGYVRNLVTAVWAGNANGDQLGLKASGLDTASYIWRNYMIEAVKKVEKGSFERPDGIKWIRVSKRSGKLPSNETPEDEIISSMFASFSTPVEYDNSYKFVEIDKISGLLATEFTPDEAREKKGFYVHQSILPENAQWESAVRKWAKDNKQDELPPTEYDNVHTADNINDKPQITIISPASKTTVSPPSLGVLVDISSPGGVEKVDYYLDGDLVYTSVNPPFTGIIPLSSSMKNKSSHTIKAIVFDELYRSSQASISIKIGSDDTPPKIDFIYPDNKAKLTVGSSISVQLDTYDPNGAVKRVRFYLDGKLKKEDTTAPFSWQFTTPSDTGSYELKAVAYDYADNKSKDSVKITAIKDDGNLNGISRLLVPRKNQSFDEGESLLVKGFVGESDRADLAKIIFLTKKSGQLPYEIAAIEPTENGGAMTYSVIWDSPTAGTYELYIKLVLNDGKLRFSKKIPIVVR